MAAMQLASPTPTLSWHNFSVTRTLYGGDAVGFSDAHPLMAQLLRHEDSVWPRCSWLLRRPPSPGTTSPSRGLCMAAMQLASPTPTLSWHNFSVTTTLYGDNAVGFSDAHPLLAQLLRHENSVWRRCSWLLRPPPSPGTISPSRGLCMAAMQLASPTPTLSWHNFSVTRSTLSPSIFSRFFCGFLDIGIVAGFSIVDMELA
ncbi:hypothetical protein B296_00023450 [Ensete ventricosum]|uniref:Uncharacterized protein n=1 Tax=Ensete ventricosum TaxID=4639 RepID=A0A427A1Q4_ENSVE|nr:hypothetical protein B296_00023450 [Ensete ventricosum]